MGSTGLRRVRFLLLIPKGVFPVVLPLKGQVLGIKTISKRPK